MPQDRERTRQAIPVLRSLMTYRVPTKASQLDCGAFSISGRSSWLIHEPFLVHVICLSLLRVRACRGSEFGPFMSCSGFMLPVLWSVLSGSGV